MRMAYALVKLFRLHSPRHPRVRGKIYFIKKERVLENKVIKARGGSDPKFQFFFILVQNFMVFQMRLLKILSFVSFSQ